MNGIRNKKYFEFFIIILYIGTLVSEIDVRVVREIEVHKCSVLHLCLFNYFCTIIANPIATEIKARKR